MLVMSVNILSDSRFEFTSATKYTASNLFFGEQREPALHQIDPRSAGRGEMQMETGSFEQPALDGR